MPQHKSATSLKQSCIKCIAQNLPFYWKIFSAGNSKLFNKPTKCERSVQFILGLFDQLPPEAAQQLFDYICKSQHHVSYQKLLMILSIRLKKVDLSSLTGLQSWKIRHALVSRCVSFNIII